MNTETMFSTGKDNWETPPELFAQLDQEFHFTIDVCADDKNHKCKRFYTAAEDGLAQDWAGETVFCNPPYSKKGKQNEWVEKCYKESQKPGTTVVMLIPARTDTARFHDYILGKAIVRFIRGRIRFCINGEPLRDKHGRAVGAPFPSMIVIFQNEKR